MTGAGMEGAAGWPGPGARAVPARVAFRGAEAGGQRSLLLGLAPGAPAGREEARISVPQTGLFRVSTPDGVAVEACSVPVPHLRLVLESGKTLQLLVDFEPSSQAKQALAHGQTVRDELVVWALGCPLQVPLLAVPPGTKAGDVQRKCFPDQAVVERGLDIFGKSMRRHFPNRLGGEGLLPIEAEFPPREAIWEEGLAGVRGDSGSGQEAGSRVAGQGPGGVSRASSRVGSGRPGSQTGILRWAQELPPDSFSHVPSHLEEEAGEAGDGVQTGAPPGASGVFKFEGRFMDRYGRLKPALRPDEQRSAMDVPSFPLDEETELAVAEWKVRALGDVDFDARRDSYCLETAEFLVKALRKLPKPAQRNLKPPPLRIVSPYAVDDFQRDVVGEAVLAVAEALDSVQLEDVGGQLKRTKPTVPEDAPIGTFLAASLSPGKSSVTSEDSPDEYDSNPNGSPALSPLLPGTAGGRAHLSTGLSDVSVVSTRTLRAADMQSNWDAIE